MRPQPFREAFENRGQAILVERFARGAGLFRAVQNRNRA